MIRWMLGQMEKAPTAVFYERELRQRFPEEFEQAKRQRLLRRAESRPDGGSYGYRLGRPYTVVIDDGKIEAFDEEDPEADPLELTLADLAEWHLDLEALARKFQQVNRLKGMPGPLEDRLFFLGEASRNGSRLAFVLGLLHDPRSARTLLAALPEWLPASYSQIVVVCPTFALQPADAHRLQRTKVALASLDHADLFCLDSAVTPPAGENVFRKEGDYWNVLYLGTPLRLADTKGLRYVAHLLRHPGEEFDVLGLLEAVGSRRDIGPIGEAEALQEGLRVSTLGDAGELVDAQAIAEYKTRLVELQDGLEEAERNNDTERAARLKEEMDPLLGQLSQALGLGGRRRRAACSAERARVNVGRQIRSAIGRIAEHDPALAGHLQKTIKTGFRCSYTPVSEVGWSL